MSVDLPDDSRTKGAAAGDSPSADLALIFECASCGNKDGKLKKCTGCRSVRYCGVQCQRAHRKTHKADCKEKAKCIALVQALDGLNLGQNDIVLPPPREECPICCQALPIDEDLVVYMACCGKTICRPCFSWTCSKDMASGKLSIFTCQEVSKTYACAYCRQHYSIPGIGEGAPVQRSRLQERTKKGDPFGMVALAKEYEKESYDSFGGISRVVPQDKKKAFELYLRAASLECDTACYELARIYRDQSQPRESVEYLAKAANRGNVAARRELADLEMKAGRLSIAMKHYEIAAHSGCRNSARLLTEGYKNGHIDKNTLESALRCHQSAREELEGGERGKGMWRESVYDKKK